MKYTKNYQFKKPDADDAKITGTDLIIFLTKWTQILAKICKTMI